MQSLKLVGILTLFTTASCYEKFNCDFEDGYYKAQRIRRAPGTYIWGRRLDPINFETEDEFKSFVNEMDLARRKIIEDNVFDTFDSYIDIFNEWSKYQHSTDKIETGNFDEILQTFLAQYQPKKTYSDNLGLLAKFFKHISSATNHTNLKEHFFVTAGTHAKENIREVNRMDIRQIPARFKTEYIIGIIMISVDRRIGYVIIDMENPLITTPSVIDTSYGIYRTSESYYGVSSERSSNDARYCIHGPFIKTVRSAFDEKYGIPRDQDVSVTYVGRALCTFEETHYRITLTQTSRLSLVKFAANSTPEAYLYAQLPSVEADSPDTAAEEIFTLGLKRNDFVEEIRFQRLQDVKNDPKKMRLFQETEKIFGFTEPATKLADKILRLQSILPELNKFYQLLKQVKITTELFFK